MPHKLRQGEVAREPLLPNDAPDVRWERPFPSEVLGLVWEGKSQASLAGSW